MYIGVDLGSTNIKAALYDKALNLIDRKSKNVEYIRENSFVEFDPHAYCESLLLLLGTIIENNNVSEVTEIAFTGQAESLLVLDGEGRPLMNTISWMDERSVKECEVLSKQFTLEECETVTGQQAILPTWPATKILWLKENRPEIFNSACQYVLLKDYVIYFLTGQLVSDMSIATFSFYFDIYNKCYWKKMLSAIGISEDKLPPLKEPCTVAGTLKEGLREVLGIKNCPKINVGTLDHFAGMIGTGNIKEGGVTLSTGTVMAMAAISKEGVSRNSKIAMHYGFIPDTHVMLPVAESGGVSLEWFKRTCLTEVDFKTIDDTVAKRETNDLIFLPYLVGTNAPEFDSDATGVFWGLRQEHDAFDMAAAVMEGVSFVLRKNCENIVKKGTELKSIIATGGGAKSPVWCQLQADITGLPIIIPKEKEAACLGAAIIAAVSDGEIESFEKAAEKIETEKQYLPRPRPELDKKYEKFNALYDASIKIAKM
ncbi:MAG: hypothetical protein E7582_06795 [Ruminococcaceae bacterium]|nr:hypothetical protein [Oscillospiraceae bacterium]